MSSMVIWAILLSLGVLGLYLISGSLSDAVISSRFYMQLFAGFAFTSVSIWFIAMRLYHGDEEAEL